MSVVYVKEQGAVIRKDHQLLRVTQGQHEIFTIPLANLEQLILMGGVQITTPAAALLIKEEVDVVFMTMDGKVLGRLVGNGSKFAQLRHWQLRLVEDEDKAIEVARQIVLGKITNQRVMFQRRAGNDSRAQQILSGMAAMQQSAQRTQSLEQLRGYEGKAAAYYFEGIRTFFPANWGFQKREYYPAPDPANALLSFIYTLLRKDIEAKINLVGLDPYLGFFHALGYNRPALALDLMEEFRPLIADSIVLNLVRDQRITLQDFQTTNTKELPVRMTEEAMYTVITAYEQRLQEEMYHPLANGQTHYRRIFELQARQMVRVIQGEADHYPPMTIR